jgi:predicted Fe-S protein YdhL (DUF1289 family)
MFAAEPDIMAIETPCIKVCIVDPASRLCRGCGRTLDEIARWSVMTDTERARIMATLPERQTRLDASTGAVSVGPRE